MCIPFVLKVLQLVVVKWTWIACKKVTIAFLERGSRSLINFKIYPDHRFRIEWNENHKRVVGADKPAEHFRSLCYYKELMFYLAFDAIKTSKTQTELGTPVQYEQIQNLTLHSNFNGEKRSFPLNPRHLQGVATHGGTGETRNSMGYFVRQRACSTRLLERDLITRKRIS